MNTRKLFAITLAALLVTAGAAVATPSQAPDTSGGDTPNDHRADASDADDRDNKTATDTSTVGVQNATELIENDTDTATDGAVAQGENSTNGETASTAGDTMAGVERDENATDAPPSEMPAPVPDQVGEIHHLISDKLTGNLGVAISDVTGNDDDTDSKGAQTTNDEANATGASADGDADDAASDSGVGDLPEQAADHVSAVHDAIVSFLTGADDGNPGEAVSATASS